VTRVYEGLVFMDFDRRYMEERGYGVYQSLEPYWTKAGSILGIYKMMLGKLRGAFEEDARSLSRLCKPLNRKDKLEIRCRGTDGLGNA
jgi:hypothetical protein